ncbi:unnamed protein product, partial [Nesidiocoris tenuis]
NRFFFLHFSQLRICDGLNRSNVRGDIVAHTGGGIWVILKLWDYFSFGTSSPQPQLYDRLMLLSRPAFFQVPDVLSSNAATKTQLKTGYNLPRFTELLRTTFAPLVPRAHLTDGNHDRFSNYNTLNTRIGLVVDMDHLDLNVEEPTFARLFHRRNVWPCIELIMKLETKNNSDLFALSPQLAYSGSHAVSSRNQRVRE